MKYRYTLEAEIEVEAPNRIIAEKLINRSPYGPRVIGSGSFSFRMNRFDRVRGSVKILNQKIHR